MPLCAICHLTNRTTRLCQDCRADPANADWQERDPAETTDAADGFASHLRFADCQGAGIGPVDPRTAEVLRLVYSGSVQVARRNRGSDRARGSIVHVVRAPTFADIARAVGITRQAVRKIVRKSLR